MIKMRSKYYIYIKLIGRNIESLNRDIDRWIDKSSDAFIEENGNTQENDLTTTKHIVAN